MELRQLRYFLKAKELMNFTEAAHSLHISQSTLSQQIKQLEDELHTPLFNRIGNRIVLTEAGALFADYASLSIKKANDGLALIQDLNALSTGTISVGVSYGLRNIFTQALVRFTTEFPQLKVRVIYGVSDHLIEMLDHFELDMILIFKDFIPTSQFKSEELFSTPMRMITAAKSALARKTAVTLREIADLPLVLATQGYNTSHFVGQMFKGLDPEFSIEVNDILTMLDLVKTGNWHTVHIETIISGNDVVAIPIKDKNVIRTATIISLKDAYEKNAMKKLRAMLKEVKI
ncbi:LysR family transcriptional regulator [Chitinophaga pinensis]|uniref:Transcriptional regulator, LysR family n=1 Tax=Chitinophaga pinensis (strain ATCC 43595 / DSM 2588 / LMG 13176 / NBRC 15968 / NCIMB 11800 / UQM 2034) TaxID=485918 RepID=A0A979GYD2_CHIPD|nr:LysR family transcriptional regulator [Chitinophaga pinensis]ACU61880.1 transcriptional regulator, LysR family [Chitinophaga pinensis DSM 2588]